jgi:hypothetical protein
VAEEVPAWTATDAGTRRVVTDGMRILHDPDGRLVALANAVAGHWLIGK